MHPIRTIFRSIDVAATVALGLILGAAMLTGFARPALSEEQPVSKSASANEEPVDGKVTIPRKIADDDEPLPAGVLVRIGTNRWRTKVNECLAVTRNGKCLITGSGDGSIRLWDIVSGRELGKMTGHHGNCIYNVAISNNDKLLASVCVDQSLRIWDIDHRKQICRIPMPHKAIHTADSNYTVAFAPDDKSVSLLDTDKMRFFAVATGKEIAAPRAANGAKIVACSPDGTVLVSVAGDNSLRVWKRSNGEGLGRVKIPPKLNYVTLSPDKRRIAATSRRQPSAISVFDIASGRHITTCAGHDDMVTAMRFSPDGAKLATGSYDRTARLWDVATGKELWSFQGIGGGLSVRLCFSPDGKTIAAIGWYDIVHLLDVATGKEQELPNGHHGGITELAFTADGKKILTAAGDCSIRLWDASTGQEVRKLVKPARFLYSKERRREMPPFVSVRLAVSPDSETLAIAYKGSTEIWNLKGERLRTLKGMRFVGNAVFSRDGKTLFTGGRFLRQWNVQNGLLRREIEPPHSGNGIFALCCSPDGKLVITGHGDRTVRLFSFPGGRLVGKCLGHQENIHTVAVSADGRMVFSASGDGVVCAWEVKSCQERFRLNGRLTTRYRIALSPNGKWLAHGGLNIVLYDIYSGAVVQSYDGNASGRVGIAFSPDSKKLASANGDTTVLIWDVDRFTSNYRRQRIKLNPKQLAKHWQNLGADDAGKAWHSMQTLIQAAPQAVALLEEKVKPITPTKIRDIQDLISDLDSPRFEVREKAMIRLEELGELARPRLEKTLSDTKSLEVYLRIRNVLGGIKKTIPIGRHLRSSRSVEVLENIGTPAALRVLTAIAKGAAEARLTKEAREAVRRLARAAR